MNAAIKSSKTRFAERLQAVDGHVTTVQSPTAAARAVKTILKDGGAERVAVDACDTLRALDLPKALGSNKIEWILGSADKNELATCDAGITSADFAIADTGTLAFLSGKGLSRSVSLLPPLHIAIVPINALVEDLDTVLAQVLDAGEMPSCLTLVTGPSRTADIEQVLTIGVHGPCALHVILLKN